MRFLTLLFIRLLAATIFFVRSLANASNVTGCLTSVDPKTDYFPVKVTPLDSQFWSIEYFKTYKVLTNKAEGTTYAVYQCGSEPPTDQNYTAVIQIPLSEVGVMTTPSITMLEQIQQLDSVKYFLTDPQYISSPCFMDRVNQGLVVVPTSPNSITGSVDTSTPVSALNNTIAFGDAFTPPEFFQTVVAVSEYREKTNAAIFEWVKFYAAFYNAEEAANAVVESASNQWDCVSVQATTTATDATKPKVLWAFYSPFCGGWDTGECPNYYCEFAAGCGVEMIIPSQNGTIESADCPGAFYYTIDELVELGKNADFFFYPSNDWNITYSLFQSQLDTMKPVQDKLVFDYQGSGEDAWYQERYAMYYDVLQDYCYVVGHDDGTVARGDHWFRNVFTEPVGSPGTCEESKENQLPFVFKTCEASDTQGSWAVRAGVSVLPFVVWSTLALFLN